MLDALVFRALTGISWQALPIGFPPPVEVVAYLEDWKQRGVLARLEAVLLVRLGEQCLKPIPMPFACLCCSAPAPRKQHSQRHDQPAEYTGLGFNPTNRPFRMATLCHRHLKVLNAAGSKGRVYVRTSVRL